MQSVTRPLTEAWVAVLSCVSAEPGDLCPGDQTPSDQCPFAPQVLRGSEHNKRFCQIQRLALRSPAGDGQGLLCSHPPVLRTRRTLQALGDRDILARFQHGAMQILREQKGSGKKPLPLPGQVFQSQAVSALPQTPAPNPRGSPCPRPGAFSVLLGFRMPTLPQVLGPCSTCILDC